MLSAIITLAVIGGLIGLIFSRKGKEGDGLLSGAKKGAKIGCFIYAFLFITALTIIIVLIATETITL